MYIFGLRCMKARVVVCVVNAVPNDVEKNRRTNVHVINVCLDAAGAPELNFCLPLVFHHCLTQKL